MAGTTIKDESVIYKGHGVLKEICYEQEKKNGQRKQQQRVLFDHGHAATALLYNREKKTIVLTKQFRLATFVNGYGKGELLEACAGLLEKGEKPEESIKREIEEETGYKIEQVEKIAEAYSSPGAFTELVHYFIAPYSPAQKLTSGGGIEGEGEEVTVVEMPFEKAMLLAENGEINDAKTLLLLYYLQAKQLMR